jgi:RimJ/RimL family protein N-acetyltransferase
MGSWLRAAPPEEIDTPRARLRRWRVEDAELLVSLVTENLEHLRPWMPWAQERPTIEHEQAYLERMQYAWDRCTDFSYAVTLLTGEPVGGMGLHTRQGPGTLEIGYWVAAAHTRRGYATACARALTDAAFALPGIERVLIRCDEANLASAAVPRRLGFTLVEIAPRTAEAPGETGRGMTWVVRRDRWSSPG